MGVLYLQEQKLARAQEFFKEALELDPTYDIAQRNLTTVQVLLPPAPVTEASPNPPQNARVNVNVNCLRQISLARPWCKRSGCPPRR